MYFYIYIYIYLFIYLFVHIRTDFFNDYEGVFINLQWFCLIAIDPHQFFI